MPKEGITKYSYADGRLDKSQTTSYQDNSTIEYKYYWNQDTSKLVKNGFEYLMRDSSSADTTYIFEDFYGFGTLGQQRSIKLTTNSMHLVTKSLDFGMTDSSEMVYTGDSIVESRSLYISDSSDDLCYEMSSTGDTVSTIKYSSSENNYTLAIQSDEFTTYYYFSYTKQETTAIRKKGIRASILPKSRSFDLLGRTVNTKRRL